MAYSSVTEEDCMTLNISVLRRDTRDQLSCMLNSNKILPSPENLPRYVHKTIFKLDRYSH